MANSSSSPMIEILFGVKGGGDINRGSGQAILQDISAIVKQIEESGATKLQFGAKADPNQGTALKGIKEATQQKAQDVNVTKQQTQAAREAAKAQSFLHQQRVKYNGLLNTSKKYKDQIARSGLTDDVNAMLAKLRDPKVDTFKGRADFVEQMDTLNKKLIEAGVYQDTFGEKTKKAFTTNFSTKIAAAAVAALIQSLRRLITVTRELDACVTDLQIATGLSREQTRELVKNYSDLAKQIGATTVEVAQAADTWLRQGYSIEEANELIIQSTMLSKLGQMDAAASSEALTSALKGYKLEAKDAAAVVDKLTAVDMESATTAGGLATAMSETANSARLAGISMDELIGYLAVVKEVTQDGDEAVGNFAKTMFARMGNLKAGYLSDPETGESLSNVEAALSGVGIKLRENNSEFRDFGEVLAEVGNDWESFSSVQQRAIAVAFAGTRQQEKFFVLMENWDDVQKYIETAATSGGTAAAKFEDAYLTGVEAAQNRFTATFENLTQSLMDGGAIAGLLEFGSAILKFLTPIASLLGLVDGLPVKLIAVAVAVSLLTKAKVALAAAAKSSSVGLAMFQKALSKGLGGIVNIITAIPRFITGIVALVRKLGLAEVAALGFKGTLEALQISMVSLTTAGIALAAVIIGSVISSASKAHERRMEEIQKEIDRQQELVNAYNAEIESCDQLLQRLDEARGDREALASVYQDMSNKLGIQIGLINDEATAWANAKAELVAYRTVEQDKASGAQGVAEELAKDQFDDREVLRDGHLLGIDWDGGFADVSGTDVRFALSKLADEYTNDSLHKVPVVSQIKDATYDIWTQGSSTHYKEYFLQQLETAHLMLASAINDYDGVGGQLFLDDIITALIFGGNDADEISRGFEEIISDESIQTAYNELVDAYKLGDQTQINTASDALKDAFIKYGNITPYLGSAFETLSNLAYQTADVLSVVNFDTFSTTKLTDHYHRISEESKLLAQALQEMSQEGSLAYDTLLKLVEEYPTLKNALYKTSSGDYGVSVSTLEKEIALIKEKEISLLSVAKAEGGALRQQTQMEQNSLNQKLQEKRNRYEQSLKRAVEALEKYRYGEIRYDEYEGILADIGLSEVEIAISTSLLHEENSDRLKEWFGNTQVFTKQRSNIQALKQEYEKTDLVLQGIDADLQHISQKSTQLSKLSLASLTGEYSALSSWWKRVGESIDPVIAALSEMEEHNYLSADTIFQLAEMDVNILSALEQQNGQYKLSKTYLREILELKKQSLLEDLTAQKIHNQKLLAQYSSNLSLTELFSPLAWEYSDAERAKKFNISKDVDRIIQDNELLDKQIAILTSLDLESSFSKSQRSPGEKALDQYKEWRSDLDHQLAMDQITEDEYYTQIRNNYKKLLGTYKETADERNKIQEELHKWDKETPLRTWDKFYEDLTHQRDMDLISDEQYWKQISQNWRSMLQEGGATADKFKEIKEQLYDHYKELYKEDLENQKDSLEEQISDIEEFYDKQKEMLEEQWDDEEKEDERAEQAKNISEIRQLIAELERDGSARAKRQLIDAREELAEAEKERDEWEKEQAREDILEALEEQKTAAVEKIETQVEKVEKSLDDISENTGSIRSAVLSWAQKNGYSIKGLASGSASTHGGLYVTQEAGPEALAYNLGLGRFTYLTPESKVWNAGATEVLYQFANSPSRFLAQYMSALSSRVQGAASPHVVTIGDIVIHGTADAATVAALRRERDYLVYTVLDKFKKMR